ncbi:30S ribosomal protein S4 [Candidatus Peregrinibacteria bacterium]|nr:30S ribosomal protein S4 [Candidatus Peregrinibacteria bacterium]
MSRYTGPKMRIARRLGVQIFGRNTGKDAKKYNFAKKNYPPGQHGQGKIGKISEYGKQLNEKQKIRFLYGITERSMRNYYQKALKIKGVTSDDLLRLLETRLDNVIFRAGLTNTRAQARQIVTHALVLVNGKKTDIPSMELKIKDTFEIRANKKNSPLFAEIKKAKNAPARWLAVNFPNLSGEVMILPGKDDFEKIIDPKMVIEYYSKA